MGDPPLAIHHRHRAGVFARRVQFAVSGPGDDGTTGGAAELSDPGVVGTPIRRTGANGAAAGRPLQPQVILRHPGVAVARVGVVSRSFRARHYPQVCNRITNAVTGNPVADRHHVAGGISGVNCEVVARAGRDLGEPRGLEEAGPLPLWGNLCPARPARDAEAIPVVVAAGEVDNQQVTGADPARHGDRVGTRAGAAVRVARRDGREGHLITLLE